jgi:hypothetical protein
MIAWHYTNGWALRSILVDGAIFQSDPTLPSLQSLQHDRAATMALAQAAEHERPAVWLSTSRSFDPSAARGVMDADGVLRTATVAEMIRDYGGLARIGVECAGLSTWDEHLLHGGIDDDSAALIEVDTTLRGSDPSKWLCSYEPIKRSRWVSVERWDRCTPRSALTWTTRLEDMGAPMSPTCAIDLGCVECPRRNVDAPKRLRVFGSPKAYAPRTQTLH